MLHVIQCTVIAICVHFVASSDFMADVAWICNRDSINFRLRTESPFLGVVHTKGELKRCAQNGTGEVNLQWSLTFQELRDCGVAVDQASGSVRFSLEVHEHRVLILEQDKTFRISCAPAVDNAVQFSEDDRNLTFASDYIVRKPRNFELFLENEDQAVDEVIYGSRCLLKLRSLDVEAGEGFGVQYKVKKCQAVAMDLTTVDLTDDKGCPLSLAVMSPFQYSEGVAISTLPSMFRFPSGDALNITCSVTDCPSVSACNHFCESVHDDPFNDSDGESIEELLQGDRIADSVSGEASTSVRILDRRQTTEKVQPHGNPTVTKKVVSGASSLSEKLPDTMCRLPSELLHLYHLCLFLCFVFLVGCLFNLCLCAKRFAKRKNSTKPSPVSSLQSNEFWIESVEFDNVHSGTGPKVMHPEPIFSIQEDVDRRSSFISYASIRQKQRPHHHASEEMHPPSDDVVFRPSNPDFFARTFHANPISVHSNSPDQYKHMSIVSNDSFRSKRESYTILRLGVIRPGRLIMTNASANNGSQYKSPLKILCLHGYRQNGGMFREKTGAFRKALKKYAVFEFIDAPLIPEVPTQNNDGASSNSDNDEMPAPRAWWFSKPEKTFSSRDETTIADGFDESKELLLNHIKENGPYDGILGFSQGASMVHLLATIDHERSTTSGDRLFKFAIIIAGFKSLSTVHSQHNTVTLNIPSLHIFGTGDEIVQHTRSQNLAAMFTSPDPKIVVHQGGHCVPPISKMKPEVVAFLESVR